MNITTTQLAASKLTSYLLERWRPVNGATGYEVSSTGKVRFNGQIITQSISKKGYARVRVKYDNTHKKLYYVHRLVAYAFCKLDPLRPLVDHINGDRKDNRSINLRFVTFKENCQNRHKVNGIIPFLGVSKCSRSNFYRASISVNGKALSLGHKFVTPEEAGEAYKAARLKYYGI